MRLEVIGIAAMMTVVGVVAITAHHLYGTPALRTEPPTEAAEPVARAAPHASSGDETRAMMRRVDALTDHVSQLREEVARLRTEVVRSDPSHGEGTEPSPEEQKAMWDEHMSLVEAGFNDETTDTRWADDVISRIQSALAAHPSLHSAMRSSECRARTCRVELDTDAQGKLTGEIAALTMALGEQLPTVLHDHIDEPGGRQTQVLYFKRGQADDATSE